MKQKLFTFFFALVASVSAIYAQSGSCGDKLTWRLSNVTLTISGTGAMADYSYDSSAPWYNYRSFIKSVIINDGVTSIGKLAFEDCSSLTSVTIPESVTSIGGEAFRGCSSLTSVTIPNSVTSIGSWAFYGCSSLTSPVYNAHCFAYMPTSYSGAYTIPEGIKQIAGHAFDGCSSLTSITIPNSVTSIGYRAFYGCSSLTSVTIPESVTSIGGEAFRGCSSLTSVTIGESVTSIGSDAFSRCSSLTSVTINSDAIVNKAYTSYSNMSNIFGSQVTKYIIGDKVKGIGDYAFDGCSSLTSVTIGNSVTSIEKYSFSGCSSLTSVTIGNSVTSIGVCAFDGCSSLTSITIPNSVTRIESSAFYGCSSLTSVTIPNSVTIIERSAFSWCSSLTSVHITDLAAWCNIDFRDTSANPLSYAHNLYLNGDLVKDLVIPNSVTSIGWAAFYGCSSLTSVTIPESVTSIGTYAFYECSSLTSVVINSDAIVNKAYTSSSNLSDDIFGSQVTEYIIGDNVKGIGDYAFYGCSSLTSITIPESVTSIGDDAFYDCSSLTSITIPNSVTSIGVEAFYNCSSLTSITIPESVTSIGNSAFAWCESLTSINVNANNPNYCSQDGVLFNKDKNTLVQYPIGNTRTEYTIPESVTSIGKSAFEGCSAIDSIVWNAKNCADASASEDAPFYAIRSQITSFTFGENVEHIPAYLCDGMDKLTSVTIPNSVTSIGRSAFAWCFSLTSVTIGNSVTSIGESAFDSCKSLTSITCEAATPTTIGGTHTFYGVSKSIPVYVPCECVEAYKAANGWKDFTNIQGPLAEYSIEVDVNDTIMGTAKVNYNTFCEGAQISATPNIGYHFVQWSDGNTENPHTLELTQDTILTAEFAQAFSGQCGDSLYWELVDTTLHITGKGEMYDYESNTAPWKLLVSSIKVLTIAEDVTKLSQSFDSCSVLESIVWNAKHAADAYDDGQYVYPIFYEIRSQIKSFTFGENVEYIPTYLGVGMDKLTSMIIPNSVTSIGEGAFYICSSLTSVTIPNSVTSIGRGAFADCSSLTSITIPNSVTSIGDGAFDGCNNITSVTWNAKNCNTYNFGSQVTSFEFGNEVEVVPSSLCEGMEKLTSVTIPNSVKTIGSSAFEGCARLGKISLGTGLEEIAANAFAGCTRLYDIYVYATYPPFAEESSFANYNVYVYVPCEYQRGYTLDVVWGKFKFIECIESEDATTDGNVTVVPGFNDVTITWPTAENADTYSLVINKDNQPFCTLTFNQDGQLLNIAFAPSRDGNNHPAQYAAQTVSGYRFTVTGLNEATQYAYNITTKDADNNTIATYSGEFTTMGGSTSAVEDIWQNTTNIQKLLRNGQLIIVRDGVEYTVMGQEM